MTQTLNPIQDFSSKVQSYMDQGYSLQQAIAYAQAPTTPLGWVKHTFTPSPFQQGAGSLPFNPEVKDQVEVLGGPGTGGGIYGGSGIMNFGGGF